MLLKLNQGQFEKPTPEDNIEGGHCHSWQG